MIWFIYIIPCLLMVFVGWLFSWLFVFFAKMQDGPANNNNGSAIAPRLPTWLRWFQTPDNSLYGDTGWKLEHCPDYWGCYLGMVMWIMRNPANYFRLNVLGAKVKYGDPVKVWGDPLTADDEKMFHSGWVFIRVGRYWCLYTVIPWMPGRYMDIEFGWALREYIGKSMSPENKNHIFSFSPRLFAKMPEVKS